MAYTAHKDDASLVEHFDSPELLDKSARQLAQMIQNSKHFIAFTGAGVSTSAGIPDFRGPTGVWTLAAKGEKRTGPSTNAAQAIPSFTHMALVELYKRGHLKFLISQNCDGLHRKSGIPASAISELHGNRNLEKCSQCGLEYMRDFDACASYIYSVHDHRTGRKCAVCDGDLIDTIINFGDNLRDEDLNSAWKNSDAADLCLVIGSSCTVTPACQMPERVAKQRNGLVICNLQNTPLDKKAVLNIHSRSDDLMKLVMKYLNIEVSPFILRRRVCVHIDAPTSRVHVYSVDTNGTPASIFPGMIVNGRDLDAEPYVHNFQNDPELNIELFFHGHYNEPPVKLRLPTKRSGRNYFDMSYNPMVGEWRVEDKGEHAEFIAVKVPPPPFPDANAVRKAQPAGFSVVPNEDCPHFQSEIVMGLAARIAPAYHANECQDCHDKSENWLCLTCGKTFCSRYVKGHARVHSETEHHNIALSFSDLSVWCYACGEYIKDPIVTTMFVGELYKAKFGRQK